MNIKEHVLPYYHLLYSELKQADYKLHIDVDEDLVNMYIEDLVRLDAFVSLLVYIDGTIPLLRCQKAFSKVLSEVRTLQYLYRERTLLYSSFNKYFNRNLSSSLDVDLHVSSEKYKKGTHEIYLNAIHVGELAISKHLKFITDDKIVIGILAYFTESLELLKEDMNNASIHNLGYNARACLSNLQFIAYLKDGQINLFEMPFVSLLKDIVLIVKMLHIEEMMIKSMGKDQSSLTPGLSRTLRIDHSIRLKDITEKFNNLIEDKDDIIEFVTQCITEKGVAVTPGIIRESIDARNLLYSLS